MAHDTRPKVDPRYPVQVTIRATPGLPSLRSPRVFGALRRAIARASVDRFRVIHFSIQQDHGHFIVEGDEARRARTRLEFRGCSAGRRALNLNPRMLRPPCKRCEPTASWWRARQLSARAAIAASTTAAASATAIGWCATNRPARASGE